MTKKKKSAKKTEGMNAGGLVEDKERAMRIATDIIEPALQEALGKARKENAPSSEILHALANCYGGLLVDLLGHAAAAQFMLEHATHIKSREEPPTNN
jgi:hypothetical protein